jgi:hypothetical protein
MKLADKCWRALALLQRKHPRRSSFSPREIIATVAQMARGLYGRRHPFSVEQDPVLRMIGVGHDLWPEGADRYVANERTGWGNGNEAKRTGHH